MLVERNENKKEVPTMASKTLNSPRRTLKPLKENHLGLNNKDLFIKSSKLNASDGNLPNSDFIAIETRKISSDYLRKIMSHEVQKAPDNFRTEFLSRHGFGWEIRSRMVGSSG